MISCILALRNVFGGFLYKKKKQKGTLSSGPVLFQGVLS